MSKVVKTSASSPKKGNKILKYLLFGTVITTVVLGLLLIVFSVVIVRVAKDIGPNIREQIVRSKNEQDIQDQQRLEATLALINLPRELQLQSKSYSPKGWENIYFSTLTLVYTFTDDQSAVLAKIRNAIDPSLFSVYDAGGLPQGIGATTKEEAPTHIMFRFGANNIITVTVTK